MDLGGVVTLISPPIYPGGFTGDFFVGKYNPSGIPLWLRGAGGTSLVSSNASSVTTDQAGNVYIGGYYSHYPLTIGSTVLTTGASPSNISTRGFIAKYDSSGAVQWAQQTTGDTTASSYFEDIKSDGTGHLFITGENDTFGSYGSHSFTEPGIFNAAVNSLTGNIIWGWNAGNDNSNNAYIYKVAYSPAGMEYIGGYFSQNLIMDGTTLTFPSSSTSQAFVARFQLPWASTLNVNGVSSSEEDIQLYPNPSTGRVTLRSNTATIICYNITDCRGALLLSGSPAQQQAEVNTTMLTPGIYFIKVKTEEGVVVKKMVKM